MLTRRLAIAAAVVLGLGFVASLVVRVQVIATADHDATVSLHDRAVESDTLADAALDVTTIGDPITLVWLVLVRPRRDAEVRPEPEPASG